MAKKHASTVVVFCWFSARHVTDKQWYLRPSSRGPLEMLLLSETLFCGFPISAFMDGVPIISVLLDGINSPSLMIRVSLAHANTIEYITAHTWAMKASITSSSARDRRALRTVDSEKLKTNEKNRSIMFSTDYQYVFDVVLYSTLSVSIPPEVFSVIGVLFL